MEKIEAKGPVGQLVDKVTNGLFKSLENLFKDAKEDEKYSKGKWEFTAIYNRLDPLHDEDGKELKANAAVAIYTRTIEWPEEQLLTKDTARGIAANKATWQEADDITLTLEFQGGNKVKKKGLTLAETNKEIEKYEKDLQLANRATQFIHVNVFLYEEGKEDTSSSKKLNVKLQKISGSKEVRVDLTRINANYDISEVVEDVSTLVSDDEFVDQMPEGTEVAYEIIPSEDEYNVEECACEDFNCCDAIQQMIQTTMQTIVSLYMIQLTASGDTYDQTVQACETIRYNLDVILNSLSDTLYDMDCEKLNSMCVGTEDRWYECEDNLGAISEMMTAYLECLSMIIVNCSTGCQSKIECCIAGIEDAIRLFDKRS